MALIAGIALGVLCVLPFAVAARLRDKAGIAAGIGAVLVSFVAAHVGLVAVWRLMPDALPPAVAIAATALLVYAAAVALRQH